MDKVRVYELARELGITSPETIALLKEKLKIRVKSASSTIEEDTSIKLKRLLRLEGASATRKKAEKAEEVAAVDDKGDSRSARKRRAEKARLAPPLNKHTTDREKSSLGHRPGTKTGHRAPMVSKPARPHLHRLRTIGGRPLGSGA